MYLIYTPGLLAISLHTHTHIYIYIIYTIGLLSLYKRYLTTNYENTAALISNLYKCIYRDIYIYIYIDRELHPPAAVRPNYYGGLS